MKSWLVGLSALALPVAAAAQPVTGLYVGGGAGADFQQNETRQFAPQLPGLFDGIHFDTGFAGQVSVGWGFGNGLRAEIEGDYAYNHVRKVSSFIPLRAGGYQQQYGGFANALYDLPVRLPLPIRPYLGIGAGGRFLESDAVNASTPGYAFPRHPGSGAVSGFAYQAIAGFAVPLPVRGLSFTTEYRFIGLLDPLPSGTGSVYSGNSRIASGNSRLGNVYNHEILIGLRYEFSVPRPPPPPPIVYRPPAPAVATRTYLVFFDWDRADLTERARAIVATAARAAERAAPVRLEVDGYTDLSGTAPYNQALSLRRAEAVAQALVADGVPPAAIAIHGYGETHPLVPTAAGVREPQNRRVEIILR